MDEQPDFTALARAWVANDARVTDKNEGLVERMALALERRRQSVQTEGLVVNISRDRFLPEAGLDPQALDELTKFVEEYEDP